MSKRVSVASSSSSYSSGDSAFAEHEASSQSPSPSPESVKATLDMYVSAARIGRAAFACGDVKAAVQQFDQALALELQTELDCLYDTSIGMVSGLVRREVDQRIQSSPRRVPVDGSCSKVMRSLLQLYNEAEMRARQKPTDPKLYLRMGAALVCTNEWDKAKKIYLDGLNACKDRKELKAALRYLCRIEQITEGKEIPTEPYEPSSRKHVKSKTLPSAFRMSRPKSASVDLESLDLSCSFSESDNRHLTLRAEKKYKPKKRRVSSFGRKVKRVPLVHHEERQAWSEVFRSDFNEGQVHMRPSAITQMRRLSLDLLSQSGGEESPAPSKPSFTAINFQSMKIDSDDSELEDD